MTKLDMYWRSNKNWYHVVNRVEIINDDAPKEAKESYKRYMEQMKRIVEYQKKLEQIYCN